MKKLYLKFFDKKRQTKRSWFFLKYLFKKGFNGVLYGLLFILFLISLDFLGKWFYSIVSSSHNDLSNSIANFIQGLNKHFGIKVIDFFKDIIALVAGILGVILGLFFTTFLSIITSKYSNLDSDVIDELLNQGIINKYFSLLAILLSSSIFFQFALVLGYSPTFLSSSIFILVILVAFSSFIFFGKYSLLYLNVSSLASDLISSNYFDINRLQKNKSYFLKEKRGKWVINKMLNNLNKVELIVKGTNEPQLKNTSLDEISQQILDFGNRINSIKYTLPSNKQWFPKIQKYKRWDEVSSSEMQLFGDNPSHLYPKTIEDFNYLEKRIIQIQFLIFNLEKETENRLILIQNQNKYLQTISYQCDIELFNLFFDSLENYTKKALDIKNGLDDIDKIRLTSLYPILIIQYLIGFNHNYSRLLNKSALKKLAYAVHYFKDIDSTMQFPFTIRKWIDEHQKKLRTEKLLEGKLKTPLFYTEHELAKQFCMILKNHIREVSDNIFDRVFKFSKYLRDKDFKVESLEVLSDSIDMCNKIEFACDLVESKIAKETNELRIEVEEQFHFEEKKEVLEGNQNFKANILKELWELGFSSYLIENEELPDIFGTFYQIIREDILDKAFAKKTGELVKYLPKFLTYNLLYIESLRKRIDKQNPLKGASKIYPIIIDLLEISGISIIIGKCKDEKILDCIFHFWDNLKVSEVDFWNSILPVYKYFNDPIWGLSTTSYIQEQKRKTLFENYIKESDFVKLKKHKGRMAFLEDQFYVVEINDVYVKEALSGLRVNDSFGLSSNELSSIFIEYFLRTRIILKDIEIKETNYGSSLGRHLETD